MDAVICWENVFGTGEGEVSFRVAGSIARLLAPDGSHARKTLFNEFRDVYGARGKPVHGAKEPSLQDAFDHRKRLVDIAIQPLQRLRDHPELLSARNLSVRGRMWLLGA